MSKQVEYNGVHYKSYRQLIDDLGLVSSRFYSGIAKGLSIEDVVLRSENHNTHSVIYKGEKYKSLSELAKHVGIAQNAIRYRVKNSGLSIEEAVSQGPARTRISKNQYEVNGNTYTSLTELSKEFGVHPSTIYKRIKAGLTAQEAVDATISPRNALPAKYVDLARDNGVKYNTFYQRIRRGMPIEEAVKAKPTPKAAITYQGKTYNSLNQLSEAYDIAYQTIKTRLEKGESLEEVLAERPGKLVYEGKHFKSRQALAKHYGINFSTFSARVRSGMTLEEAIKTPVLKPGKHPRNGNKREIYYNGNRFENSKSLAEYFGINIATFYARKRSGMSIEEIITTPVRSVNHSKPKTYKYKGEFLTVSQLAEKANINRNTLATRLKKGWNVTDAVEHPPHYNKLYRHAGEEYTIKELSQISGLQKGTLIKRLGRGLTVAEAIENPLAGTQPSRKIEYGGQMYTTLELANYAGLSPKTLNNRISQGWSIKEAIADSAELTSAQPGENASHEHSDEVDEQSYGFEIIL